MLIKASGVGETLEEALVKVREDLKFKMRHEDKVERKVVGGVEKEVIGHDANEHAAELEQQVKLLGAFVQPFEGHLYRVLVSVSDDRGDAHATIAVDLMRK